MIEVVIDQRRRSIAASRSVVSAAVGRPGTWVGPFIFFDHIGPVESGPRGSRGDADVRPHPHIGLSTVTYLFAGEIMHRDSTGIEQADLPPVKSNWMTAGSGYITSLRNALSGARREGGPLHGIQSWIALPDGEEETPSSFAHHEGDDLPVHQDRGLLAAGSLAGGSVRVAFRGQDAFANVFTSMPRSQPGARVELPRKYARARSHIGVIGCGRGPVDRVSIRCGMAVFADGAATVSAATAAECPDGSWAAIRWASGSSSGIVSSRTSRQADRAGEGGMARRPDEIAGCRQCRVHPVAARPHPEPRVR